MTSNGIIRVNAIKGSGMPLFGRITTQNGEWATTTTIDTIHATVKPTGQDPTFDADLVVEEVLEDVLVTVDKAWTDDVNDARIDRGYNFKWPMPASCFPEATWYTITITFTDTDGEVTKLVYEGPARGSI